MPEEKLLDGHFPEYAQLLLEVYDLQCMVSCDVDRRRDEREGGEGTAELINL